MQRDSALECITGDDDDGGRVLIPRSSTQCSFNKGPSLDRIELPQHGLARRPTWSPGLPSCQETIE